MTKVLNGLVSALLFFVALVSCHPASSDKSSNADTALITSTDTTVIPGSPGPSGSQPGAADTTQAHRDSLKKAEDIADSSGGPHASPK
jgi:hypothetical protein